MTGTAAAGVRAAGLLDPALPGLAAALAPRPPDTTLQEEYRIRSVEWMPARRCRVVHEVRQQAGPTELIAYDVTPTGTTVRRPADDDELPGLSLALSPAHVGDRLAGVCGAPVGTCRITPVGYRPGIRAVVAYDVVAGDGRQRLYAKVLAAGAERYAAVTAAVTAEARRRGEPAPVPEIVAVWPDLAAVVQRAAPGEVMSQVFRDERRPEPERLRYARLLGRLMAGLHATPGDPGPPTWSAEDELTALEALLAATCHADPSAGRSLADLVDHLADTVCPEDDVVLTHGAFRTGQVLADGGALTLLDLDTVAAADAARDAGNVLAYLAWAGIRGALPARLAGDLQEAVLGGYAEAGRPPREPNVAWWTAAAMGKIAGRRYRSLATAEWPHAPRLLRRAVGHLDGTAIVPAGHPQHLRSRDGPASDPLDPRRMTDLLRAVPALDDRERIRVVDARPLAPATQRRTVVRYEVEGLDPDGAVALVGKIYADRHRSSLSYENLRLLGGAFAATPRCAVPAPVCHVPDLRMVLYRQVTGTPLEGSSAGAAVAGLAAGWLATLHSSGVVLARRLDLAHEVEVVAEWATCVGERMPGVATMAAALAERLATAAATLPAVRQVPIHKDFHAGHVIAVGNRSTADDGDSVPSGVVVIDLDEARMGDSALDVAHLAAYLGASPWPEAPGVRAAFLAAYGPVPGPSPEQRSAFFTAYTDMKIARQLVTGRGPVLGPAGQQRQAAVSAVLRRGLACLPG